MSLIGPTTNRRSNATTAYDLMTDIRTYILEEPRRIFMDDWVVTDPDDIEAILDGPGPECGTIGCIAGNVRVLTGQLEAHRSTYGIAVETLAGDSRHLEDELYNLFHDTDVDAKYGTKKYARIVAQRIAQFQKEHGAALRAVAVAPPPSPNKKRSGK